VRDSEGKIRALYNRCTHRGTTLCAGEGQTPGTPVPVITAGIFTTPAKLRGVPWPTATRPTCAIRNTTVAQVPRMESYRGFIFGTLNMDALPLVEHLGRSQP